MTAMRCRSRRSPCAMVILVALLVGAAAEAAAAAGAAAAEPAGKHDQGRPPEQQYLPNAWAWITATPQLSSVAGLLTLIGADEQLSGPFTGTLLLPTNEAVAAYVSQLRAPLNIADTDEQQPFWKLFFRLLLDYHTLLLGVNGGQRTSSRQHSTRYFSSNGLPHRVTFLANGSCTAVPLRSTGGSSSSAKQRRPGSTAPPEPCRAVAVQDEQGNSVTFAEWRTAVQGGGVMRTIDAVLQPNDIFPSLTAALSSPNFTILGSVLQQIDAALNITVLEDLEKVPGTLAAPLNEAFAGLNLSGLDASTLLSIVTYHFCLVTQPWKLVYTPFVFPTLRNPCITLLGRTTNQLELQLTFKQQSTGLTSTPRRWVAYPTTAAVGNKQLPVNSTARIAMADITVPLHVVHAVQKLLLPPS